VHRGSALELADPLRRDRARRPELDASRREPTRQVADEDLAGLGALLEARRLVHRWPRDERLLTGARDDLTRVHTEPELEGQTARRIQLADALAQREGGADRALGVVIVRRRRAEDRHHRVADELLDGPAVLLEDLPHLGEGPSVRTPDDLGVVRHAGCGRADDVGEQDGDQLALVRHATAV